MMSSRNRDAGQLAQKKVNIYYNFLQGREFSEDIMGIH
jgi:hypothetical protein